LSSSSIVITEQGDNKAGQAPGFLVGCSMVAVAPVAGTVPAGWDTRCEAGTQAADRDQSAAGQGCEVAREVRETVRIRVRETQLSADMVAGMLGCTLTAPEMPQTRAAEKMSLGDMPEGTLGGTLAVGVGFATGIRRRPGRLARSPAAVLALVSVVPALRHSRCWWLRTSFPRGTFGRYGHGKQGLQ